MLKSTMKIFRQITLLVLSFFMLSFLADKKDKTPKELGLKIFEAIKNQKEKALLDLIVTEKETENTLDQSDLPDSILIPFKKEFITKLNTDKERTKEQIQRSYTEIINDINIKNCKKNIQIGNIIPITDKLRNLPVEIGQLEIEYKCSEITETISVKIINTSKGWRILEKLRKNKRSE
ncbi:MAG: hypothetical protein V4511_15950 [Bacteroidota bacterium]